MEPIARYDDDDEVFNFNMKKLREVGIELNVLRCKESFNAASEMALDLLVMKALKEYFRREKIVSFNAADLYLGVLKKSSNLVEIIKSKKYFVPHPIDPDKFSQEDILRFYKERSFNPLLGMMAFAEKEYEKHFEKNLKNKK